MASENKVGTIGWIDLTLPDAEGIRSFYQEVVGWESTPVDMGGYNDHCMIPPGDSKAVAGICHAKGVNANIPPVWLIYIIVANLDLSLQKCEASGGKVLAPARSLGGYGRMAVIQDPAGVISALFESEPTSPPE